MKSRSRFLGRGRPGLLLPGQQHFSPSPLLAAGRRSGADTAAGGTRVCLARAGGRHGGLGGLDGETNPPSPVPGALIAFIATCCDETLALSLQMEALRPPDGPPAAGTPGSRVSTVRWVRGCARTDTDKAPHGSIGARLPLICEGAARPSRGERIFFRKKHFSRHFRRSRAPPDRLPARAGDRAGARGEQPDANDGGEAQGRGPVRVW